MVARRLLIPAPVRPRVLTVIVLSLSLLLVGLGQSPAYAGGGGRRIFTPPRYKFRSGKRRGAARLRKSKASARAQMERRGKGPEADPFHRARAPETRSTNRTENELNRTQHESELARRLGGRAAGADLPSTGTRMTRGRRIRGWLAGLFVAGAIAGGAAFATHAVPYDVHFPSGPPPISTQAPSHNTGHPTVPTPGGHSGGSSMPTPGHQGGGGSSSGNTTPDPGQNTPAPNGQGGTGSHGGSGSPGSVHPTPTPTHSRGLPPGSHSGGSHQINEGGGLRRP